MIPHTFSTTRALLPTRSGWPYIVLVTLLLTACGQGGAESVPADSTPRLTPIAAVEVRPRDLSRELSLAGVVISRGTIRLASRTSGTVERVLVEEGERVDAGELLLALDTREQQAELARAQAEVEQARLDYQRTQELRRTRVLSEADYQRSRAALAISEANLALWQTRVDFGEVRAPRAAMVTARLVEPGEAVSAQDTLLELAAMDDLVIRLGVSELDVVHLAEGQLVPVVLDAMPGHAFPGEIRRIFPTADTASRLVTVEVALPADATDRGVRPGYLARVRITIDARGDVLAVPAAAIGEEGEDRFVFVVENDRLRFRAVVPGVTRGQWTEIVEGLVPGDVVLATNPIDMRDGLGVRVVGWRG